MSLELVILAVLAAGLPLYVWWLLQLRIRYPWNGRPSQNPRRGVISRHGLTSDEADDVADAVVAGERLPDERLRAAAADWAEVLLRPGRPRNPRTRHLLIGLLLVWVAALAALVVWAVVMGHAGGVPWAFGLVVLSWSATFVGRRRQVLRSLERNSDALAGEVR